MNPFEQHGALSWGELITSDPEAAKAFYGELFGWTLKPRQMGRSVQSVIEVAGQEMGHIAPIPPSQPQMKPTWGTFITVDDVAETAAKATELGGKVLMPPLTAPDVGTFALIQDPQGALFAIVSYALAG